MEMRRRLQIWLNSSRAIGCYQGSATCTIRECYEQGVYQGVYVLSEETSSVHKSMCQVSSDEISIGITKLYTKTTQPLILKNVDSENSRKFR